jgi:hypothetical protein
MNAEISKLISSIEDSSKQVKESFSSLTETQLNWKPAPDKWSAGECIEHLIVTNKQYYPALDKIIKGEHKNSFWQSVSPLSGLWGSILIKAVSPDNAKKMKTAKVFEPATSSISKEILDEFVKCNDELISYLKKLGSVDLKKTKIYSPVNSFITYSLWDAIRIITYHEVRHINQAKRVTETEGFPKQ